MDTLRWPDMYVEVRGQRSVLSLHHLGLGDQTQKLLRLVVSILTRVPRLSHQLLCPDFYAHFLGILAMVLKVSKKSIQNILNSPEQKQNCTHCHL